MTFGVSYDVELVGTVLDGKTTTADRPDAAFRHEFQSRKRSGALLFRDPDVVTRSGDSRFCVFAQSPGIAIPGLGKTSEQMKMVVVHAQGDEFNFVELQRPYHDLAGDLSRLLG